MYTSRACPGILFFLSPILLCVHHWIGFQARLGLFSLSRMHKACLAQSISNVRANIVFRLTSPVVNEKRHTFGLSNFTRLRNFTVDHQVKGRILLDSASTRSLHHNFRTSNSVPPRNSRYISWSFKSQSRSAEFTDVPDNEEDVARAAILDKVMKGRQPTDLMLRCESLTACFAFGTNSCWSRYCSWWRR